ncbi:MAG: LON peptidase substrate-binding domain-containing protein [Nitratireductor sp.]|nr:LON peptidase substrate-binding domain-containing protein [Nitratireductor sp.]
MKAGNQTYGSEADFPAAVPVFPLSGALLLPGGNLPLNIFEPRYLAMTDHALAHDRLIGLIQPDPSGAETSQGPKLCQVGCLGRLTGFQETGDGRYRINLTGVCRFRPTSEEPLCKGFRSTRFSVEPADLKCCDAEDPANRLADRKGLLATFRRFLAANQMETDWDAVERTDDETLVTALCMMSPYGPAEKQALLEARDLNARAETLVAITEIALAKSGDASSLQ